MKSYLEEFPGRLDDGYPEDAGTLDEAFTVGIGVTIGGASLEEVISVSSEHLEAVVTNLELGGAVEAEPGETVGSRLHLCQPYLYRRTMKLGARFLPFSGCCVGRRCCAGPAGGEWKRRLGIRRRRRQRSGYSRCRAVE